MDKLKTHKLKRMKKIEDIEEAILELEDWEIGEEIKASFSLESDTVISSHEERKRRIKFYEELIKTFKEEERDDGKLYLSEIVKKKKIKFDSSNSLILAPVGSGKTTLIHEILSKSPGKALMLVSNTALKNSTSPNDNEIRRQRGDRTYTTQNKRKFGDKEYEIYVMSYAEFGRRVRFNDDFIEDIKLIFCDEIHSLPHYQGFNDSAALSHAMKTLFSKHEGKKIYYFTATNEYLVKLEKENPGALRNVDTYNFLNDPEIKQYIPLSEYRFSHIEQIRPHLKSRIKSFNYFGYKGLAFSRTIEGQNRIAEIAKEEGFKPLVLWSVNNEDEDKLMTDEQINARNQILTHGLIPAPYNFLIINSAMQEGWDLFDNKVKLAIMNTMSTTEKVQALGRLRDDIDILAYKVKKTEPGDIDIIIPEEYLNRPLTSEEKDILVEELNVSNDNGVRSKWPTIKFIILNNDSGYNVKEHTMTIDGKRVRVTTISMKDDIE